MWSRIISCCCVAVAVLFTPAVECRAPSYYQQWNHYTQPRGSLRLRMSRSRRTQAGPMIANQNPTLLVSRKETAAPEPQVPEVNIEDLSPIGLAVFGVTKLAFTVLFEYCTGFLTGYLFGTLVGTPGFVFKPMTPDVPQVFRKEVSQRFSRMNGRALDWGRRLGGFSSTFKGCDVAVRLVRYNKDDQWNEILGSAAAGAMLSRKDGPAGMVRGALLWGAMVYVFNGGLQSNSSRITQYTEQPVEF